MQRKEFTAIVWGRKCICPVCCPRVDKSLKWPKKRMRQRLAKDLRKELNEFYRTNKDTD